MEIEKKEFDTIDSTNRWAKEHAESFTRDTLTVVSAIEQTAGYGQKGRHWHSPKGNIYASFCFFLDTNRPDLEKITPFFSTVICQVLEELNLQPKIKWPNDIFVNRKKAGGVLVETVETRDEWRCIIAGLGLNVKMSEEELQKINQPTTTVGGEMEKLLTRLESAFSEKIPLFTTRGLTPFEKEYQDYLLS